MGFFVKVIDLMKHEIITIVQKGFSNLGLKMERFLELYLKIFIPIGQDRKRDLITNILLEIVYA